MPVSPEAAIAEEVPGFLERSLALRRDQPGAAWPSSGFDRGFASRPRAGGKSAAS